MIPDSIVRRESPPDWSRPLAPQSFVIGPETQELSLTLGTPPSETLGLFVAGPNRAAGATVHVWLKRNRTSVGRGLTPAQARTLAADLLVMAEAAERWWPNVWTAERNVE